VITWLGTQNKRPLGLSPRWGYRHCRPAGAGIRAAPWACGGFDYGVSLYKIKHTHLMANTYTQLHIQLVFAVKGRASLIHSSWREELFKYITGIVQNHDHKMLQINGMPDHIHIFIGQNPKESISGLVETIKTDSNHFIKRQGFCPQKFSWQDGFGAFSYGRLPAITLFAVCT